MSTADPVVDPEQHESMGDRLKAAGRLAAKQAQRAKLASVTLPSVYKALGRQIYGRRAFAEDFSEIYQELDRIAGQLKAIKSQAGERPAAEGIAAKAKGAAMAAKDMAQTKGLEMQAGQQFSNLGEAAYTRHGDHSGPPELVDLITNARGQLAEFDSDIAELSKSKPGQKLTPKRIVLAGLAAVVLIGGFLAYRMVTGSSGSKYVSSKSERPFNEQIRGESGGSGPQWDQKGGPQWGDKGGTQWGQSSEQTEQFWKNMKQKAQQKSTPKGGEKSQAESAGEETGDVSRLRLGMMPDQVKSIMGGEPSYLIISQPGSPGFYPGQPILLRYGSTQIVFDGAKGIISVNQGSKLILGSDAERKSFDEHNASH